MVWIKTKQICPERKGSQNKLRKLKSYAHTLLGHWSTVAYWLMEKESYSFLQPLWVATWSQPHLQCASPSSEAMEREQQVTTYTLHSAGQLCSGEQEQSCVWVTCSACRAKDIWQGNSLC